MDDSILEIRIPKIGSSISVEGSIVVIEYNLDKDSICFFDKNGKLQDEFVTLVEFSNFIFYDWLLPEYQSFSCIKKLFMNKRAPDRNRLASSIIYLRDYFRNIRAKLENKGDFYPYNDNVPVYVNLFRCIDKYCDVPCDDYDYFIFSLKGKDKVKPYFEHLFISPHYSSFRSDDLIF